MRCSASVMAHTATVNHGGVDCNPPCLRLQRHVEAFNIRLLLNKTKLT